MDTPVLFLIFNRPELTKKVFEKIREARPKEFFIAADGARTQIEGEWNKCDETRKLILSQIDWPCKIYTLFREKNLGCGIAVSEAITWFFEHIEQGIILEDDTVPNLHFFNYCEILLNYYKDEQKVMQISGNTFHDFKFKAATNDSYYYSSLPFIWGWATWKRAWKKYDYNLIKNSDSQNWKLLIENNFKEPVIIDYWLNRLKIAQGMHDSFTWDYQWFLTIWKSEGVSISPRQNLVKNIGWGADATHTTDPKHHLGQLNTFTLGFPLKHPKSVSVNKSLQEINFKNYFKKRDKSIFPFLPVQIENTIAWIKMSKQKIISVFKSYSL